jgi:hypothetical protein
MRFEVPQFIEIEDKIFGPFTWKQGVYLAGGVGLAVVILFTLPMFVFVLVGIPLGTLAGLLAFYPVNNRPFSNFLESIVTFYNNAKVYSWRKKANIVYTKRTAVTTRVSPYAGIHKDAKSIRALSRTLEINNVQK